MNIDDKKILSEWKEFIEAKEIEGVSVGELNKKFDQWTAAVMLENTLKDIQANAHQLTELGLKKLDEAAPDNVAGNLSSIEKILMPIVRRMASKMVTKELMGVQPMSQSNSVVFALTHHYGNSPTGPEAGGVDYPNYTFAGEKSDGSKGGTGTPIPTDVLVDPFDATATLGGPGSTAAFEGDVVAHMTLSIQKTNVEARSMAMRATISPEAITDMRNYHGLNMENEVQEMLANELTREQDTYNSRVIAWVAKVGDGGASAGQIDLNTDTDGRWRKERIEHLFEFIGRESAGVFMDTRRSTANKLIVSSKLAMALAASGYLQGVKENVETRQDQIGALQKLGTLFGIYDVYMLPWVSNSEFFIVGYHGGNVDSGLYYCPYVPLSLHKAVDPVSFANVIGFKTRFGLVQNPFVRDASGNILGQDIKNSQNLNPFWRKVKVVNV